MKEGKNIQIRIAGQAFVLESPSESEEMLKEVERNFNKIWAKWCNDFRDLSHQQVLAMVAFQYARHYQNLVNTVNANENAIKDFEQKLDSILLDVQ